MTTDNRPRQDEIDADERRAAFETQQEIDDLHAIMKTEGGRRFMWRLLSKCGVYQQSFTGNSQTFFREGRRSIGLEYIADVNEYCLEQYVKMVRESQGDRTK